MTAIVEVKGLGRGKFAVDIKVRANHLISDEGKDIGGDDLGPNPHEFVLAGLGACTVMTLRMYADHKKMPLEDVLVQLSRRKIDAATCPDCRNKEGEVEEITRTITLVGPALSQQDRARLFEIANKCPVHRTLSGEIKIRSTLVPEAVAV